MDPVTIARHTEFNASPDELWSLISDPERLSGWLGDAVDVDLREGGRGTVIDGDLVRQLTVERVDEGRGVSFTWWDAEHPSSSSRVTLDIEHLPDGGSRLEITETMLASATADLEAARSRWEVRVLSLWACTVAAALAQ